MVLDMRAKIRKFVSSLGIHVNKLCQAALLISNMDTFKLMVYAQQVEENNKKDREENQSKNAKYTGNEGNNQKSGNVSRSFFQKRSSSYTPSSASTSTDNNKNEKRSQARQGDAGNRAQSSLAALPNKGNHRGSNSGVGGGSNHLYDSENYHD
ncbi:uncharacterized protein LOC129883527 [Solanum dulcamara]|uniref:uncharacterized protein LOC129883527 n=1 Tax=Solanum dulcamara TaxID=45834 RepID=UPI002485A8D2|nr:uncharacterized protein LOC129883527 [Solanum dulcamara]